MENIQQQDDSKELKSFESNIKKLTALLGSDKPLKGKTKLPKDEVAGLVTELFKEDREAKQASVKTKIKELVLAKINMDKAFKQKQQEIDSLRKEKYKEFNKAANDLFNEIEGISELEKQYYDSLKSTTETTAEE